MVVESVGAVAVATDELADASVTAKATLAFLQKKKKKQRSFYGKGLVFIPAGGGVDVTSTVVAASTDRHVVAVRQPWTYGHRWTCTGSFMLMWNRCKTRRAGKRSGSGFTHAEAHFPNIYTACFSFLIFLILGGKSALTSPINDPTFTKPGHTGSSIIILFNLFFTSAPPQM